MAAAWRQGRPRAMAQILVVDHEVGIRELLSEILSDEGHDVLLAEDADAARKLREQLRPDLVLLSGHGPIEPAVEATRGGALDYLEKPIALQRLLATVKRALRQPEASMPQGLSLTTLGRAPALTELKKRLAQLAQTAAPLMLRGEHGMRPELFARLLCAPGAPFVVGDGSRAEASSELLARATGGILFIPDLSRLRRGGQKGLEFLLARADRHKARVV